jgi:hypothetical protein
MGEMTEAKFEQAIIPVQAPEFYDLKAAIERLFGPPLVEKFLKRLSKARIPVRHFEDALAGGHLDKVAAHLARSGRAARDLYTGLPVSDQAQIREFYLVRLEQVDDRLRSKFREIYYCH